MLTPRAFLIKLVIVCTAVVLADVIAGGVLSYYYFKIDQGEQGRTTYAIDSCNSDIIITGSSRASHHYVPSVLSDSLQLGSYNAGKDKQGIFYDLAILKAVMIRDTPKIVLLDLTPVTLSKKDVKQGLDALSILLPYYRRNEELQEIINNRSKWEFLKTYSSLYRFNSLPLQIVFNNLSKKAEPGVENGYVPILGEINSPISEPQQDVYYEKALDKSAIEALKEIIRITEQSHSKLIVIVSPIYLSLPNQTSTITYAREMCKRYGINFLDFSQSPYFTARPYLFADEQHLNNRGAHIFSQILSSTIKGLLAEQTVVIDEQ